MKDNTHEERPSLRYQEGVTVLHKLNTQPRKNVQIGNRTPKYYTDMEVNLPSYDILSPYSRSRFTNRVSTAFGRKNVINNNALAIPVLEQRDRLRLQFGEEQIHTINHSKPFGDEAAKCSCGWLMPITYQTKRVMIVRAMTEHFIAIHLYRKMKDYDKPYLIPVVNSTIGITLKEISIYYLGTKSS